MMHAHGRRATARARSNVITGLAERQFRRISGAPGASSTNGEWLRVS